jgi:hypothetical protein
MAASTLCEFLVLSQERPPGYNTAAAGAPKAYCHRPRREPGGARSQKRLSYRRVGLTAQNMPVLSSAS